ncbi:MAG: hypothetical protein P9L97_11425 [Candidatus Tenebribacter davisii]|jgi:hypothetical protein|nr:hypothetical protein [Candidatus Tenebribacter davisii]
MEDKYLKDLVIALIVILLIVLGVKCNSLYQKAKVIPVESKYKKLALSEDLFNQIQNIEHSINDRKEFVFTVTKDPLEQNLIVKTIKDLEKQWRLEVESMVRLETTIVPEIGRKRAAISHKGKTKLYEIGDSFYYGIIKDIRQGEIVYSYKGVDNVLKLQKLPEKPTAIQNENEASPDKKYNW